MTLTRLNVWVNNRGQEGYVYVLKRENPAYNCPMYKITPVVLGVVPMGTTHSSTHTTPVIPEGCFGDHIPCANTVIDVTQFPQKAGMRTVFPDVSFLLEILIAMVTLRS